MWFLWGCKNSPVYGKERMTTFERYFIEDKSLQDEPKDTYYSMLGKEEFAAGILKEFGLEVLNRTLLTVISRYRRKKASRRLNVTVSC